MIPLVKGLSFMKMLLKMKKTLLLFLICILAFTVGHFRHTTPDYWDSYINENLNDWLNEHFNQLERQIEYLEVACRNLNNKKSLTYARKQFKKSRYVYKKLEVITATVDPFNAAWINGPNLPKVEYEKTMSAVSDPEGFQVLEEVLFGEEPHEQRDFILKKISKLKHFISETRSYVMKQNHYDWMVFHCLRMASVRLATMGITGFDCPVTLDALNEAKSTLNAIEEITAMYDGVLYDDREGFNLVKYAVQVGYGLLNESKDFNSLDRARFILEVTDPIFRGVTLMQESLGIEFPEDRITGLSAINPHSKGMFYNDFLKINEFFPQKINKSPTPELISLGKLLFYDPILSDGNQRSCASCHQPQRGFSDGLKTALSLDGMPLSRNTPTLLNVVYQTAFQWDGHLLSLSQQFTEVTFNRHEMNKDALELTRQLNSSEEYRTLFKKALGSEKIDFPMVIAALEAYLISLQSLNSPFDQYMTGKGSVDREVVVGFNLFMGKAKCGTCHFAPIFNGTVPPFYRDTEYEVLGIPQSPVWKNAQIDPDPGRYILAKAEPHLHAFKSVTVRNAHLTGPYMHNGIYTSLDEVIEFYNVGGGHGIGISLPNQTLPTDKLHLTEKEKRALKSFITALTDTAGLTTPVVKLPKLSGE